MTESERLIVYGEPLFDTIFNSITKFLKQTTIIQYICIILYAIAIVSFIQLPDEGLISITVGPFSVVSQLLARRTYVSEKNLQCGVEPGFNHTEALRALRLSDEFRNKFPLRSVFYDDETAGLGAAARWIQKQMDESGLDTQLHQFDIAHGKF